MASSHTLVVNAFRPGAVLDDPALFAGRVPEIKALTDALHSVGGCPIIYGDRGLGKTSLALQMRHIAKGDSNLLRSLGLQSRTLQYDSRYVTIFVTCDDLTKDFSGLLQVLIRNIRHPPQERKPIDAPKSLASVTTHVSWGVKMVTGGEIKTYLPDAYPTSDHAANTSAQLIELIKQAADRHGQRILFIIDELDRLVDTRGLAAFIRAASRWSAQFLLVGIASNLSDLLADHESLSRSIVPVQIPPMSETELHEIIDKTNSYLRDHKLGITVSQHAATELVRISAGFPWFVHVVGQSALISAWEARKREVDKEDVVAAVRSIASDRFTQPFSDLYQNAVRNSRHRELVLRALAEWRDSDIPISEVYRILRLGLGVRDPSAYRKDLGTEKYGKIILTSSLENQGIVRFSNEMFKVYVRTRGSIYEEAATQVVSAFAEYYSNDS